VRQVSQLIEHVPERGQVSVVGGGGGGHVAVRVHAHPGDVMPGVMGELGEECPLGAAVALAERVQGIDVGEEPGQPGDERVCGPAPRSRSAAASRPNTSAAYDSRCCGRQNTDPFAMETVRSWPAQA
jgi:hypothetical protein